LPLEYLEIRRARVHNLKNIDLKLPHNQLTVVTGVSGSGKSSLAFDTIYAEGQRRYVESMSAYARQFLERIAKPDVDEIVGIAPAIAIRQKNTSRNPRSTVATATEIYDFLRLLFARAGRTFCARCGARVRKDTVDEIAAQVLALDPGSRWYVLFPVRGAGADNLSAETLKSHLFELRRKGFNRLFQNGRTFEFSAPESLLEIDFRQPVFALADRIVVAGDLRQRVVDTVESCFREAGEAVFQSAEDPGRQFRFTEKFECKTCRIEYEEPEPRLFSFNSPFGACPRCQGFGNVIDFDMERVIPDPTLSLDEGAVEPWTKPSYQGFLSKLKRDARGKGLRCNVPFRELTKREQDLVFQAIQAFFQRLEQKKYKMHVRVFLSRYRGYGICPECRGARLRKEALNVTIGGRNIAEVVSMSLEEAKPFFERLELTPEESAIADKLLQEIRQRLSFLNDVGLEYLTMDRLASTLSGGEAQRIQLATSLGSRLVGACYVLDEPSIGLHPRDTARLIHILRELRALGNTIVVVEHDRDVMRAADHIVDLGPGAGEQGGAVVFQGPYSRLVANGGGSLTGRYLAGEIKIPVPAERRRIHPKQRLRFYGAYAHNLKSIDVAVPLHALVAVTGVSGSGKSTLVHDVIYCGLRASGLGRISIEGIATEIGDGGPSRVQCRRIEGRELVDEVILVDQSPIGRTPRSNPITYLKAFDLIREIFAARPEARKRGYTAGHFSFNIAGGRCETCQGDGVVTVEMQFLADVELICEDCKGKRYKNSILEIEFQGRNIYDVLQLTVTEALSFFAAYPRITSKLKLLADIGLGYLRLGQSATTLSGGEAQRVKLAAHLAQARCDRTLYIFDEPTTGLHFDDIAKLLAAFRRLINNGGSVLVIEHNLDVIKTADWVIDLGPEGGERGGRIVAEGTPEQVAACPGSYTGRFLLEVLDSSALEVGAIQ
jgi:excinuclease ABC subunit A